MTQLSQEEEHQVRQLEAEQEPSALGILLSMMAVVACVLLFAVALWPPLSKLVDWASDLRDAVSSWF